MHLLDLDKDTPVFAKLIREGIEAFNRASACPLQLPITRVDIQFDLLSMEKPFVWAYLDTEPNGEPQSGTSETWTIMERFCEHWVTICHAIGDEPVTVRATGRSVSVENERTLDEAVGPFFVELIKALRDDGVFRQLPRAAHCYLGVSAIDGWFAWPVWENRGPDNMM